LDLAKPIKNGQGLDAHGCRPSAGYHWNDAVKSCAKAYCHRP
jgi:hypothetical protein